MLVTDIATGQISEIYQRFGHVIGEAHWKKRACLLKNEVKGNRFLSEYIAMENALVFQLDHLRMVHARHHVIPHYELENRDIYPAVAFATQVLSIMDSSPPARAEQLRRRVHGAIKNPDDMRALRLELVAATHFTRRGCRVVWPEMTGEGSMDLLVEGLGPSGLEIECKSISDNKGRKIHRQDALRFYKNLWEQLKPLRYGLRTGLSVVLTVPGRLPTKHTERQSLAKRLATQIIAGTNTILDDGTEIRLIDFDVNRLGDISKTRNPTLIRKAIDNITGTRNREGMVTGTREGGALVLAIQSSKDDLLINSIFDALSDSAKRQFSGQRAAIFLVGLEGLDGDQLLSLADQDDRHQEPATLLRKQVSKFLDSKLRDHVVGVGFLSRSGSMPVQHGIVDTGGAAYYFPKRESPFWDNAFSGLFNPSQSTANMNP